MHRKSRLFRLLLRGGYVLFQILVVDFIDLALLNLHYSLSLLKVNWLLAARVVRAQSKRQGTLGRYRLLKYVLRRGLLDCLSDLLLLSSQLVLRITANYDRRRLVLLQLLAETF
jgi:hypothetical protein